MSNKHLILKVSIVVLLISLTSCAGQPVESSAPRASITTIEAVGTNGHAQADNVFLSVIFDNMSNKILAIAYNPRAPQNNTTDTRSENTGRGGQAADGTANFMQHLTPWRNNRAVLQAQMVGLDALVLAEMDNVSAVGAAATAIQFDGRTLDAVTGATMTRNSFINAVLEASRLFRDSR